MRGREGRRMQRSAISPTSATSASPTIWRCRSISHDAEPVEMLYRAFLAAHDRVYGHSTRVPAKIVNLRTVHQCRGRRWSPAASGVAARAAARRDAARSGRGSGRSDAGGDLAARRDRARTVASAARRSSSRPTPRPWSSRAGPRDCADGGALLILRARMTHSRSQRSIRSPSRSPATSSKASPTRCSRRCCAAPSRRSSRRASTPRPGLFTRGRPDPGAGLRHPDPSRDADPGRRRDHRDLPARRRCSRRRHLPAERSLSRRHASARYRGGAAGLPSAAG